MPKTQYKVLDHGSVELVDTFPSIADVPEGRTIEYRIVQTARISTNASLKSVEEDRRLLRYLFRNHHTSPFENVSFIFKIKCPIFVARQIQRHRTAKINEFSQRYSEVPLVDEYYHLSSSDCGIRQAHTPGGNKQGSEEITDEDKAYIIKKEIIVLERLVNEMYYHYHELVKLGMAKETARAYLPLGCYTEFFWNMDLHNLLHFLKLRMDNHAQWETRQYANAIYEIVKTLCPTVIEVFDDVVLNGIHLTGAEIKLMNGDIDKLESMTETKEYENKIKLLNK